MSKKTHKRAHTKSLADFPHLLEEWDLELNYDEDPSKVGAAAGKRWWRCKSHGHKWYSTVAGRTERGYGCPYCSGRRAWPGFNDLETLHPELAAEWDRERNEGIMPDRVRTGSHYEAWWRCAPHGHSYQMQINTRVGRDRGCTVCSGFRIVPGVNDLQTKFPTVAAEWVDELNEWDPPTVVAPKSSRRGWWRCPEGHVYDATVRNRTFHGSNCPYCTNQRVLRGFNDLASRHPEVAAEWDYDSELNADSSPETTVYGASRHARGWKCTEGHTWKASVVYRTAYGYGCPDCVKDAASKVESRLRAFLQTGPLGHPSFMRDKDVAVKVPWRTRQTMRVDFLGHLPGTDSRIVVEYDGSYWHSAGDAPERDLAKTQALLDAGYYVVRVREKDLPALAMRHDRLLQFNLPWHHSGDQVVEAVERIEYWALPFAELDAA